MKSSRLCRANCTYPGSAWNNVFFLLQGLSPSKGYTQIKPRSSCIERGSRHCQHSSTPGQKSGGSWVTLQDSCIGHLLQKKAHVSGISKEDTWVSKGIGGWGYRMAFHSRSGQSTDRIARSHQNKGELQIASRKRSLSSASEVLDYNLAQQLPGSYGQRTHSAVGGPQSSPQDILTACQVPCLRSDMPP